MNLWILGLSSHEARQLARWHNDADDNVTINGVWTRYFIHEYESDQVRWYSTNARSGLETLLAFLALHDDMLKNDTKLKKLGLDLNIDFNHYDTAVVFH